MAKFKVLISSLKMSTKTKVLISSVVCMLPMLLLVMYFVPEHTHKEYINVEKSDMPKLTNAPKTETSQPKLGIMVTNENPKTELPKVKMNKATTEIIPVEEDPKTELPKVKETPVEPEEKKSDETPVEEEPDVEEEPKTNEQKPKITPVKESQKAELPKVKPEETQKPVNVSKTPPVINGPGAGGVMIKNVNENNEITVNVNGKDYTIENGDTVFISMMGNMVCNIIYNDQKMIYPIQGGKIQLLELN